MISFILLALAIICFVIATFNLNGRLNWVAAGLALWALEVALGAYPGN